ncbi:hypothetical protein [Flavobacterium sp. JAS]|uniref:hypothetical protein n=1 Tax=Flavobacterium sp. JAS TaxID=2897329 RepID=UPI001E5A704D|nr:hypothetical protein [Flavobacterium sp. JAS]MCD0472549.1 hypothetical protein [Flavobacterium sp. JAS]
MKEVTNPFFKIGIIIVLVFFLCNCSNQNDENNDSIQGQDPEFGVFKTVSLKNSIDFFTKLNSDRLTRRYSDDIGLDINLESLQQVDIEGTDAKVNLALAATKFEGVDTEVLQVEIDGELQTVLFHQVPEIDITDGGGGGLNPIDPIDPNDFTGSVYTTDLDGRVLSGFKIVEGVVSVGYDFTQLNSIDPPIKLNEVIIPGYVKPILPPTNDAVTRMDYQFVRSQNNGSAMGIAYFAAINKKVSKEIDDEIDDSKLPPCLKNILSDLKKTSSSPGNLITKFTGNLSSDYNWTMESGPTKPDVPAHTLPGSYNATTGIKTVFDVASYPEATELSWARTMMHESIHAYLTTYYIRNPRGLVADYPVMFQEWISETNRGLNATQHEEIARSFVKSFADAFEAYGVSKGYKLDKQFYQDMAWGGLIETDAFMKLPEADRKRISNTIEIELRGKDDLDNVKPQKGKKAGC